MLCDYEFAILSQFILKFQAFILFFGAIFKMENNFYTTTLSMTEISLATIYSAQFRWNGLRWKICLSCKLINKFTPLLGLSYFLCESELKTSFLTNLLCSSLTANRLSGNIPGHLGSFTALTYLYGLNLL